MELDVYRGDSGAIGPELCTIMQTDFGEHLHPKFAEHLFCASEIVWSPYPSSLPSGCQRAICSAWVCKYAPGPKWWS